MGHGWPVGLIFAALKRSGAMKRAFLFAVLFAGSGVASAAAVLSANGYGDVKIGMKIDQVERVLHSTLAYNPYANHGCSITFNAQMEPYGISYVIDNKVLTRINLDFTTTDERVLTVKTDTGIGLRSPEEDVMKAYAGRVRVQPNSGDPSWHTLYVDEPDQSRGIVFETDGKKVKSIRAGAYPAITYQEPCS